MERGGAQDQRGVAAWERSAGWGSPRLPTPIPAACVAAWRGQGLVRLSWLTLACLASLSLPLPQVAILAGDFLLARASVTLASLRNSEVIMLISQVLLLGLGLLGAGAV